MAGQEKDDLVLLLKLPSSPEALRTKTKNTSGFPQSPQLPLVCVLQNNFTARIHLTTKYGSKPLAFFPELILLTTYSHCLSEGAEKTGMKKNKQK